jgi:hypothetical protein
MAGPAAGGGRWACWGAVTLGAARLAVNNTLGSAASRQPLECPYAEADLLLEADLNDLQERQRSSGRARDRRGGA